MFHLNLQGDAGLATGVHGAGPASCFTFPCFPSLKRSPLHCPGLKMYAGLEGQKRGGRGQEDDCDSEVDAFSIP